MADVSDTDVVISEIGGTVGDIESLPFLEAIRQFRREVGPENVVYLHVTFVPFIETAGELKTKPTQHSVNELRRIGIHPDVVICRSADKLSRDIREKIALFADVDPQAVIANEDVSDVYLVPQALRDEGLDTLVAQKLGLPDVEADLGEWDELASRIRERSGEVQIALVGKYVKLHDAYLSVHEALKHAGIQHRVDVKVRWFDAEGMSLEEATAELEDVDGVLVPGGFGSRGWEGKITACRVARENGIPYLGICLGMQVAVSEFARHVVGLDGANSTEMDPETPYPVIDLLPEQKEIEDLGGTMRLGADAVDLEEGTGAHAAYGEAVIHERHRHRYEVNNHFRPGLVEAGLVVSGTFQSGRLVEVVELPDHPWFVASQFHPEFKSRPTRPAPLFRDFVGAALERARERAAWHRRRPANRLLRRPSADASRRGPVRLLAELASPTGVPRTPRSCPRGVRRLPRSSRLQSPACRPPGPRTSSRSSSSSRRFRARRARRMRSPTTSATTSAASASRPTRTASGTSSPAPGERGGRGADLPVRASRHRAPERSDRAGGRGRDRHQRRPDDPGG